jgi:glycosyltransferase involved in cell wall biosynthesis
MSRIVTQSPLNAPWPVAVFARNEEERIAACLNSLSAAAPNQPLQIFVLANDCTDRTEDVVRALAQRKAGIKLVSRPTPGKANAWNVYVHEIAPDRDLHFFVDGDVEACADALLHLHQALDSHPEAHAASAVPGSGRSLKTYRQSVLQDHGLAGNLYVLRGAFVSRIRQLGMRVPIGLIGTDGLIGALAKWDLDPKQPWDEARVVPCPKAEFKFTSFSWQKPSDWRRYWRRKLSYALRHYHTQLLQQVLLHEGIQGIPATVQELYVKARGPLRMAGFSIDLFFSILALRRIRRERDLYLASGSRQLQAG